MAKKSKAYLGLDYIVSLILAIIPVTSLIFGILQRIKDGCIVAAIIRIFIGWNIWWILDLICMILKKDIFRVLDI